MTDFAVLNYPPILGGMGKWQKNVQNLYMNKENNFLIPRFFAPVFFGGILPILPILGDIGPFCYS